MPRLRHEVLSTPHRAQAVIGAATNFSKAAAKIDGTVGSTGLEAQWQRVAWLFYDTIGEYRYSVTWVGNLMSRAKLELMEGDQVSSNPDAMELMDGLYGGKDGQADMLRQIGVHFTVAGDCYLIGVNTDGKNDDWLVGASSNTRRNDEGVWRAADEDLPGKPLVMRLWRPHPQNRKLADSPTRAVLPILSEIDGLTKRVAAEIDSRLAGAGILLVPNEISFGAPPTTEVDDTTGADNPKPTSQPDELVELLIEVMGTALTNREDASALVPIVLQGPGDSLKDIKHITFATPLDAQSIALRSEAIRRLALGMDMPPEVLTGTSDMNHWSSWQVEEAAIKAHTEPLLAVICQTLTEGYLRPMLDVPNPEDFWIRADTTALRLRPNRSKEAQELYQQGLLSEEATVAENGFDPATEMMTDKERIQWLLRKVASGSTTPNLVNAALQALGVELNVIPINLRETIMDRIAGEDVPDAVNEASNPAADQQVQQSRPDPSLQDHPVTGPPVVPSDLTAAGGLMVYRALERAGNKIKSRLGGKLPGIRAVDLYRSVAMDFNQAPMEFLLDDAWSAVEEFAPLLGVESTWLTATLDSYTRGLLVNREPFTVESLSRHLAKARADA